MTSVLRRTDLPAGAGDRLGGRAARRPTCSPCSCSPRSRPRCCSTRPAVWRLAALAVAASLAGRRGSAWLVGRRRRRRARPAARRRRSALAALAAWLLEAAVVWAGRPGRRVELCSRRGGRGHRGDHRRADGRGHPRRHRHATRRRRPPRWSALGVRPGPAFAVALVDARGEDARTRWRSAGSRWSCRPRRTSAGCGCPRAAAAAAGPRAGAAGRAGGRVHPGAQRGGHGRRWSRRLPARVPAGRSDALVVDDGSPTTRPRGPPRPAPRWSRSRRNRGLGAAVRRGLAEASALRPAARGLPRRRRRVRPGGPRRAWPGRCWRRGRLRGRLAVRRRDRAHAAAPAARQPGADRLGALADPPAATSPTGRAATARSPPRRPPTAEVVHDYNYAQVLTLDLLGQGLRLRRGADHATRSAAPAPRSCGSARYLRRVVPAVHRELNAAAARLTVLDDVRRRTGRGRRPRPARIAEPSGPQRGHRVVGHRQRVVGVVVREQPEPAERRHPRQRRRPRRPAPARCALVARGRRPGRRAAAAAPRRRRAAPAAAR